MSLRVWLPLTKDLRQQGLSNVTVTNNGATFNSAGKLGGCYEFASGKRIQTTLPSTSNLNSKAISFACWVNISSWNSSYDCLMSIADGTGWQQSRATLCRNNTASTLCWNIADGSTSTRVYTTTSVSTNTWYHVACTYDGANLKIYVNGALNNSAAATLSIGYAGTFNIGGWSGNNYPINCKMNDIRVYNHCLSPMEVKELAKGLVLHYPLNRQGWGQENNIKIATVQNRGCSNFIYNSSTNEWTMTCPTGSSTWGFGIVLNDRTIAWKSGESWLVSMDVYTPRTIRWQMDINNKPDLADISSYTGNDYDDQRVVNTNGVQGSYQLQAGWNKLWFTQRAPSTYGLTNYSTNWGVVTTDETSTIDIKIKNIKGEIIGSGLTLQPTPWCPNSSDALATTMGLNSTTEYDCSGFCNNGTRTGTFTWTSDTPKYSISTGITAGGGIFTPMNITFSQYTIAFWAKHTVGSKMLMGSCPSAGTTQTSWYWYGDNSFKYPSGEYYYTYNGGAKDSFKWTHFVATYDGANVRVYRNGVSEGSKACTGDQAMAYLSVGYGYGSNYTENSNMSDFRIYATALSADDVKSLYQNCATIDPDGTIRGQIRS